MKKKYLTFLSLLLLMAFVFASTATYGLKIQAADLPGSGSTENTSDQDTPTATDSNTDPEPVPQPEPTPLPQPAPIPGINPSPVPDNPTPTPGNNSGNFKDIPAFLMISNNYEVPEFKTGDKDVRISLPLLNWGAVPAQHVSVTPVMTDESRRFVFPFEIKRGNYAQGYPDIANTNPGSTSGQQSRQFGPFTVRSDLNTGYYRLTFRINFYDRIGGWQEATRYAYIKIDNPSQPAPDNTANTPNLDEGYGGADFSGGGGADVKKPVPRLVVGGFTTEPEKIFGGDKFKLKLKLRNTSKSGPVSNIRLVLSGSPEGQDQIQTFLPVGGASTVYVDEVGTDSTKEVVVELQSSAQLPQKAYPLAIHMQYEDETLTEHDGDETISIVVNQHPKVEIGNLEIFPGEIGEVGKDINISFTLYNKGRLGLYNVSALIDKDDLFAKTDSYIGNVPSGESRDAELTLKALRPTNPDEKVKFIIRYEDPDGKSTDIEQELEYTISEDYGEKHMDGPDFNSEFPDQDQSTDNKLLGISYLWWLILLLLVIVGVVYGVISKRRKQRRQQELDDLADLE